MDKLKIELTEEQLKRALVILGSAPYSEIADVIDDIKYQANEQLIQRQNQENQ